MAEEALICGMVAIRGRFSLEPCLDGFAEASHAGEQREPSDVHGAETCQH